MALVRIVVLASYRRALRARLQRRRGSGPLERVLRAVAGRTAATP